MSKLTLVSLLMILSLASAEGWASRNQPTPQPHNPCGPGAHLACHNGLAIQCACVADAPPIEGPLCPQIDSREGSCTINEIDAGCASHLVPSGTPFGETVLCERSYEE